MEGLVLSSEITSPDHCSINVT